MVHRCGWTLHQWSLLINHRNTHSTWHLFDQQKQQEIAERKAESDRRERKAKDKERALREAKEARDQRTLQGVHIDRVEQSAAAVRQHTAEVQRMTSGNPNGMFGPAPSTLVNDPLLSRVPEDEIAGLAASSSRPPHHGRDASLGEIHAASDDDLLNTPRSRTSGGSFRPEVFKPKLKDVQDLPDKATKVEYKEREPGQQGPPRASWFTRPEYICDEACQERNRKDREKQRKRREIQRDELNQWKSISFGLKKAQYDQANTPIWSSNKVEASKQQQEYAKLINPADNPWYQLQLSQKVKAKLGLLPKPKRSSSESTSEFRDFRRMSPALKSTR